MFGPHIFQRTTRDIRISVQPAYSPEHSDPAVPRFVFTYQIRIENGGDRTVQLLRRHWYIHDDIGEDTEVEGEGVVGEQPVLAPDDDHEYASWCVLRSPGGSMQGTYRFRYTDGHEFDVAIPRFILRAWDA